MSNKNDLLEKEKKETADVVDNTINQNINEEENIVSIKDMEEKNLTPTFVPVKKKTTDVLSIFTLLVIIFIVI